MDVRSSLSILYRGSLSSCNYECPYCPFAKKRESPEELKTDRDALERFCQWVAEQTRPVSVFFTPWGEALTRYWYRQSIIDLSHLPHVTKVAVQTNLHAPLAFLSRCNPEKTGLWCTYHPGQVPRERFLRQCNRLKNHGVSYSVGVVGMRDHISEIESLSAALEQSCYLWVNAYKREENYYSPEDIRRLTRVDPHFPTNNQRHKSLGKPCRTGNSVISVDHKGDIRRCHFIPEIIGNIYSKDEDLRDRPCSNQTCGCHIGYVHLDELGLNEVYGNGILERVPHNFHSF